MRLSCQRGFSCFAHSVGTAVHRMFRHRNLMRLMDACVMPSPSRPDFTLVHAPRRAAPRRAARFQKKTFLQGLINESHL